MLIDWHSLGALEKTSEDVDAPWLLALESFNDATYLKIEAEGSWSPKGSAFPECGPDGLAGITMADEWLVMPECRFGALLGKIGGSSAHHFAAATSDSFVAGQPFAVGKFCVVKIPDGALGPLYLGFNVRPWLLRVTKLSVKVFGARPTT